MKMKIEYKWQPTIVIDLSDEEAKQIIQGDVINMSNAIIIMKQKGINLYTVWKRKMKIKVEYQWKPTQVVDITDKEAKEIIQGDVINVSNAVIIAKERGL